MATQQSGFRCQTVDIPQRVLETEYWIEIAQKANIISEENAKSVLHDCGSIRRMLIASINKTQNEKDHWFYR